MDSIHDYCEQLSIGSIVQCTFEDGQRHLLPVRGLKMVPDKEVLVAVPDRVKSVMVDCLPATITPEILKKFGFQELKELGKNKEVLSVQYDLMVKNPLKLIVRQVPNGERFFNIFVERLAEKDDGEQFFFIGRARFVFKLQDIYRTLANKPLVWKR